MKKLIVLSAVLMAAFNLTSCDKTTSKTETTETTVAPADTLSQTDADSTATTTTPTVVSDTITEKE